MRMTIIRLPAACLATAMLASWTAAFAEEAKPSKPPAGFETLFNGENLDNWRGQIAEDPRDIAKITQGMTPAQVAQKQKEADEQTFAPWIAKDGTIYYDGTRGIGNIETREHFGDFEMFIDWKIPKGGDSGIFPRNMPQVQIWDPAGGERNVVGSGGLDNNGPDIAPSKKADHPVGQWNTFYIRMVGEKIWVKLNGVTVIDGEKKGNYWKEFKEPPPKTGPIVLQSHGSELWFRNVFIRRLDEVEEDLNCMGDVEISPTHSYHASLRGRVESRDGRLTRFDLVARGPAVKKFFEDTSLERTTQVIAFRLTEGSDEADRIPPGFTVHDMSEYLR